MLRFPVGHPNGGSGCSAGWAGSGRDEGRSFIYLCVLVEVSSVIEHCVEDIMFHLKAVCEWNNLTWVFCMSALWLWFFFFAFKFLNSVQTLQVAGWLGRQMLCTVKSWSSWILLLSDWNCSVVVLSSVAQGVLQPQIAWHGGHGQQHSSVPEQELFGTWQSPCNQMLTRSEQQSSLQGHLESQPAVMVSLRSLGVLEHRRNWHNLCVFVVTFRAQTKGGEWTWGFGRLGWYFSQVPLSLDLNGGKCPLAHLLTT